MLKRAIFWLLPAAAGWWGIWWGIGQVFHGLAHAFGVPHPW